MIVVKFGGHAMKDENGSFSAAILAAKATGEQVVVVHGGGPQIDAALNAAGITSEFVGGFRVTTPEIFTVVENVLCNEVGPEVARVLSNSGTAARAISGRTLPTLVSVKKSLLVDGSTADLGFVGDVVEVNTQEIKSVLNEGLVPVISPVSAERNSALGLNVNADLAAAAIAGALDASVLVIMTDVPGIYRNWPDKDSIIDRISAKELEDMKSSFVGGMAPKVQAVLDAISQGANAVRIIDGTDPIGFQSALAGHGGTLVVA